MFFFERTPTDLKGTRSSQKDEQSHALIEISVAAPHYDINI